MTHKLEPVLNREQIAERILQLGEEISRDYRDKEPVLICVLRGSVYFAVDLTRAMSVPHTLDFMAISSYDQEADPLGIVRITKDLDSSIANREVLIIEDIVDTGLSLNYLIRNLKTRDPAGLRVCTLLNIPARRIAKVPIDYQGFELPNIYAVGYGLDYHEQYRNLWDIYSLTAEKE
ncbi:hypoxanthine phosphoribosyltransferase [Dethiobacter alkaliphilus]|uniref:hypoxanthine phosphoribosyltransferase n=1 Tax=Dethiobacter alkaliphilus TaxID=427926 RepID=UPI0022271FA4|nr:hypoxanthine phosphoribosyltransferase [Dethiobacter alkaliphilus]MCW3489013.1 hypoxanthine phosphoribosyltransferase [Dethiobacter alkaliphilus]